MNEVKQLVEKLEIYFDVFPVKEKFPEVQDEMELGVLILRSNNCSYSTIQRWLGNPSKKWIRKVLLKWSPELIDIKTE